MPPAGRRLLVVAYRLSEQNSHYCNELLGYLEAANPLGLSVRVLVPRPVKRDLARALQAETVLDPLVETGPYDPQNPFVSASAYTSQIQNLQTLWAALAAHDPRDTDMLLFTSGQPALIAGIGLWLASRTPEHRPSVFFRIVGDEFMDWLTGPSPDGALFYHLACADLRTRAGQERVFFLGSSAAIVRRVSRSGGRRVFATAIPKHLAFPRGGAPQRPARPAVYIHLNARSAPLWGVVAGAVHRIRADGADVDFIVKPSGLSEESLRLIDSQLASVAEILPANQDPAEYLKNFLRCTVVLLPYEAKPYETLCSGVFVEALSCGKPVVVPGKTLMAQQLAAGHAAGTVFENATLESVTAALAHALRASDELTVAAAAHSSRVRLENSSQCYVERMIALVRQSPDMEPRYQVGEDVDFSDVADSRCFMREGWGDTEQWGVWTVAHRARLSLRVTERRDLALRAFVQPLLTKQHPTLVVTVVAAHREIARWVFDAATPEGGSEQWCEAPIRCDDIAADDALDISFVIDAPHSPLSEDLSCDSRMLGIGLYRLVLS